jgi:dimethylhistidine N-methyltransferase
MNVPEYYLTDCELEIFSEQTQHLADLITEKEGTFDLIELGAGDCLKTSYLLSHLVQSGKDFTYMPIDISENIINSLEKKLPAKIPCLRIKGLHGDYFDMLAEATKTSVNRRVVLCLGANVGNMPKEDAFTFCTTLSSYLMPGDIVIMGFDLIKNPRIIQAAYDDAAGITARFNLHLLERINLELGADFDLTSFEHFCSYEPETGACKSFLISLEDKSVFIQGNEVGFKKDEYIWTEISQKYTLDQVNDLAHETRFSPMENLLDSKKWFTDSVWEKTQP